MGKKVRMRPELRVGKSVNKSLLGRVNDKAIAVAAAMGWTHLPIGDRIADKLGDILFASDEILDMIRCGRAERPPDATVADIERRVTAVYHQINELMRRVAD
jgi:hypothetical protein